MNIHDISKIKFAEKTSENMSSVIILGEAQPTEIDISYEELKNAMGKSGLEIIVGEHKTLINLHLLKAVQILTPMAFSPKAAAAIREKMGPTIDDKFFSEWFFLDGKAALMDYLPTSEEYTKIIGFNIIFGISGMMTNDNLRVLNARYGFLRQDSKFTGAIAEINFDKKGLT